MKHYEVESRENPTVKVLHPREVESSRSHRFSLPTRKQFLSAAPFLGVILLAAILRFWGLGDKPLHHDESLHAYFSLQLLQNNMENWLSCFSVTSSCYTYDPLLHGPFQFHIIALVYKISQLLGVYDHGVNTFTVRIPAATLGTLIVGLPYFLRDYIGKVGAWLACCFLAISPSMVYFSRFAREDIYMACFTLLLAVAVGRYVHSRRLRWIIIAAVAFTLSYATKEATFLSLAIFGSFFGVLLVWELGLKWKLPPSRYLPQNGALVTVVLYFLILAPIAKVFFDLLKAISIYITDPRYVDAANAAVQLLKNVTVVVVVPCFTLFLGLYLISVTMRKVSTPSGRRGIAARIDPQQQPLLDTIFTMAWTHWFLALLCAAAVFLILFTALFTNIVGGIADGIWQGLYYWLQQQQVARGGQPWYYYLLLIPLYEQIGLVFGIIGIIRCLVRPTRFRLFLVYWFVGNVFIYSWAAEKMPWLMIHMTMPLMLLAAIGLEPAILTLVSLLKSWMVRLDTVQLTEKRDDVLVIRPRSHVGVLAGSIAGISFVLAIVLLLPTLQNMYQVTYVHAADGPHEMMVYVQTTTDVDQVMMKIDTLDQKLYAGKHQLSIGVMNDAAWPFMWYLRDYSNVCYQFPTGCSLMAKTAQVIIAGGDNLYAAETRYATSAGKIADFKFHQYHMRTWWDEGYKPLPCVVAATNKCDEAPIGGGVGPLLWLSYGDNPPPNAKFDPALAAKNVWQWWWNRKAIGGVDGSYDMGLFIRSDLGEQP